MPLARSGLKRDSTSRIATVQPDFDLQWLEATNQTRAQQAASLRLMSPHASRLYPSRLPCIGRGRRNSACREPIQDGPRADFVTHLIATAEHVPQTRTLRRATPADAKAAYGRSGHNAPF